MSAETPDVLCRRAVICISLLHKLLCILQIDSGRLSLALHVRAIPSVFIRSFIMDKSRIRKRPVYNISCSLHIAFLVCILYTQYKISAGMFGDQICIECCP